MTAWSLCRVCEHPTGVDTNHGKPLVDFGKLSTGVASNGAEKWAGKRIRPSGGEWTSEGPICYVCAKKAGGAA